jgi:hypothetical protein
MYGLPDSAIVGTTRRLVRVSGKRSRKSYAKKNEASVATVIVNLAEYYRAKRAEKKSNTPKK